MDIRLLHVFLSSFVYQGRGVSVDVSRQAEVAYRTGAPGPRSQFYSGAWIAHLLSFLCMCYVFLLFVIFDYFPCLVDILLIILFYFDNRTCTNPGFLDLSIEPNVPNIISI